VNVISFEKIISSFHGVTTHVQWLGVPPIHILLKNYYLISKHISGCICYIFLGFKNKFYILKVIFRNHGTISHFQCGVNGYNTLFNQKLFLFYKHISICYMFLGHKKWVFFFFIFLKCDFKKSCVKMKTTF
jgi:hypothetical protein